MSRIALALLMLLFTAATPAAGTLIHSERSQYREVLVYEDAGTRCALRTGVRSGASRASSSRTRITWCSSTRA